MAELGPSISQYFTWRMNFAAHKACRIFCSVHRKIRRLKLHGRCFSGSCPPENPDARFGSPIGGPARTIIHGKRKYGLALRAPSVIVEED